MAQADRVTKDITLDFLRCNRCGKCRAVCPVLPVFNEEWASARGKVELAEVYFREGKFDEGKLYGVFDYCLHCMTCEENCPSGVRANELVMAVRADLARKGRVPWLKRAAIRSMEGMDNFLFRAMRFLGVARAGRLHGVGASGSEGGGGVFSFIYPLLGWPRERVVPLPHKRPVLERVPEFNPAGRLKLILPGGRSLESVIEAGGAGGLESRLEGAGMDSGKIDLKKAAELLQRIAGARKRNLAEGKRAYYFVGHAVNHFFPEEGEAVVGLLNILGVDVVVPRDQGCCGAPAYFAGDVEEARKLAAAALERFSRTEYSFVVTSCASGGYMLKNEYPRLLDVTEDGYFELKWDEENEAFVRGGASGESGEGLKASAELYRRYIKGRVFDVNEVVASMLGLKEKKTELDELLKGKGRESKNGERETEGGENLKLPVVTYHHPCHLNRGQGVNWQPEEILRLLPGRRYERMKYADRCCGGGGAFTFAHAKASDRIAAKKVEALEELEPELVATSCPVCRVQLRDVIVRHLVEERRKRGLKPLDIPVTSTVELLLEEILSMVEVVK